MSLHTDLDIYKSAEAFFELALAALAKKRAAERDADERRAIAKAFNDRYCYRNLYNPKAPRLEGTAKGGIVTAANMSPEERAKRARKGSLARWGAKPIRALPNKGNFLRHFGVDVECYIADDERKTAVISQTGMARILGLSARGNAFPRFVGSQALADSVSAELRAKVEKPLLIQWGSGGAEQPPSVIHGYDATVLTEVCAAIAHANAKGKLSGKRYEAITKQAANLLECEYAEDARQSRRLYQIAQHIRDLKKGSL